MNVIVKKILSASILSLLILTGSVAAQEVEGWNRIELGHSSYGEEPPADAGEPIERLDTVMRPTLIQLPATGVEGSATVQIDILEGEAELYTVVEGVLEPFSGYADIGPEEQTVVAVVPAGKALVGTTFEMANPCLRKWTGYWAAGTQVLPGIHLCSYLITFQSDWVQGCSGLIPGVSWKFLHDYQLFGCTKGNIIFND